MVQEAYLNGETRVQPYVWHSHANILAEILRKPNVVLVPQNQQLKPCCNFRAIQTYCEVKYKDKDDLLDEALMQITEVSGDVSAMQLPRWFFVSIALCGSALTLTLHAHGGVTVSKPVNINKNPHDFLCILLGLSLCSPAWNRWDDNFFLGEKGYMLSNIPVISLTIIMRTGSI